MLLITPFLSVAFAVTPPPIVGGSQVSGHPYKQVGAFVAEKGGFAGSFCSGTLVAARRVITAAHCVEAAEGYQGAGYTLYFVVADQIADSWEASAEIKSMYAHPDYSAQTAHHDIAVLYLESGIQDFGTMSLNTQALVTSDVGENLTYVGYGLTDSDKADSGGTRRKVNVPIYFSDNNFVYTYADGESKNVCSGDSGGAAMWKDPDTDSWELVGVNTFVFDMDEGAIDCDSGKPGAAAVRIDRELEFLEEHVEFELEGDSDTDAYSDSDTDTDTDADSDSGVLEETDADTGGDRDGGQAAECGGCSQGSPSGWWALGLVGLLGLRRRRS
ncbi:MAG: MYXO-CTERM domain-containing protein [Cognaticolwellia sp.]|jgi:MYXO-CTERM domain-containing protein